MPTTLEVQLTAFAKREASRLAPLQRAAFAASCADRVYAALGQADAELVALTDAVLEAAWLHIQGGAVGRDERKARTSALAAYDLAYVDLTAAEAQVIEAVIGAGLALEKETSLRGVEQAAAALAGVVSALAEQAYERTMAHELEWLKELSARCSLAPELSLRRGELSWPSAEAPDWLTRCCLGLEGDDAAPLDFAASRAELPRVLAERAALRAEAFASTHARITFPPWREPAELPKGFEERPLDDGLGFADPGGRAGPLGLFDEERGDLLFAPPYSLALSMNAEQTELFSWRVEARAGSDRAHDFIIERYAWPARKRLGTHRVGDELLLSGYRPERLTVPNGAAGSLVRLSCRRGDLEAELYIAYRDDGATTEAREASLARAFLESAGPDASAAQTSFEDELEQVDAIFPRDSDEFSYRGECERLLPRALALAERVDDSGSSKAALFVERVARCLIAMNRFDPAEGLARRSLALLEQRVGKKDPLLIRPLLTLGHVLMATERAKQAKTPLKRALSIAEANYGENHADVASCLRHLGAALHEADSAEAGVSALRRSLAIRRAIFPAMHPELASGLNDLAAVLPDDERDEIEELLREALAIRRAAYGDQHPDVAVTLDNMSHVLDQTERHEEAEALTRQALAIFEECYGENASDVAVALTNLARRLETLERHAEALPYFERVVAIQDALLGTQSRAVAEALRDVGDCLHELERYHEAAVCYRRALAIDQAEGKAARLDVVTDLDKLATTLEAADTGTARAYYRRALAVVEKARDAGSERLADACLSLANCIKEAGQQAEATQLAKRALGALEAEHGKKDPRLVVPLLLLAELALERDAADRAEAYSRRALALDEAEYGKKDPELVASLLWLGKSLTARGELKEAEKYLKRALALDEIEHGEDDAELSVTLEALGAAYEAGGRLDDAARTYQRMLAIDEATNGATHSSVADDLRQLSGVLVELERFAEAEQCLRRAIGIYEASGEYDVTPELRSLADIVERQGRSGEAELLRERVRRSDSDDSDDYDDE